jgi:hypothetical protein
MGSFWQNGACKAGQWVRFDKYDDSSSLGSSHVRFSFCGLTPAAVIFVARGRIHLEVWIRKRAESPTELNVEDPVM